MKPLEMYGDLHRFITQRKLTSSLGDRFFDDLRNQYYESSLDLLNAIDQQEKAKGISTCDIVKHILKRRGHPHFTAGEVRLGIHAFRTHESLQQEIEGELDPSVHDEWIEEMTDEILDAGTDRNNVWGVYWALEKNFQDV